MAVMMMMILPLLSCAYPQVFDEVRELQSALQTALAGAASRESKVAQLKVMHTAALDVPSGGSCHAAEEPSFTPCCSLTPY